MQGSEVIYTAHTEQEPPLTPGEDDSNVVPPYVAYSANGRVSVSYAPVTKPSKFEEFRFSSFLSSTVLIHAILMTV